MSDVVIVIDSREQLPLTFGETATVVAKLDAGDYSLQGYEHQVAVERKTLEDAYGCVGASRARFIRCLERLSALDRAAIVIESTLEMFSYPPPRTMIDARMAVGSYISWSCQYRIPVFFAGSRGYAERVVWRFLMSWLKYRSRVVAESGAVASLSSTERTATVPPVVAAETGGADSQQSAGSETEE